jgi:DNA-binding transcriptional ArsR family regulator
MAIVEQLSLSGPLTATELADRLDESPANCSWHLRKLAQHGFVEEAEGGKGRQRPWRVPSIGFTWSDDEGKASADERHAAEALSQVMLGRALDRLRESERRTPEQPEEWRRAAHTGSEVVAWLTADELQAMNDEIKAVLERHFDRLTDPEKRPPGARLCEFVAWGVPVSFPGVDPA